MRHPLGRNIVEDAERLANLLREEAPQARGNSSAQALAQGRSVLDSARQANRMERSN